MSKKSKTTETSNTNQLTTSTPTVAPWLAQNYQNLGGQISDFSKTDPTSYVAGPSTLQSQAFGGAGNLGGWQSLFDKAGATVGGVAGAGPSNASGASLLDGGLDRYLNAGLNDVVDSSLANFDYANGRDKAAMDAKGALNKSFNNTRSVFGETQFAADSARQRAATEADLRYGAFDKAAALAAQDAQMRQQSNQFNAGQTDASLMRQLQAAGLFGDLGNNQANNQRADVATQLGAGAEQQRIDQAKLNATPTFLQLLASLNGSMPIGSFTSMTGTGQGSSNSTSTTKTSDPMGALSGLLSGVGSLASGVGALKFG